MRLDAAPRVRVTFSSLPAFCEDLAHGRPTAALLRLPSALRWLMNNQTVLPAKSYELLDEAGLLVREGGKLVKTRFDNRKLSPYARVDDSIIY